MNIVPAVPVNYLAVVAAAVASMVLGWLWYGPVFGKAWAKLSGVSMDKVNKKDMPKMYVSQFVIFVITAYVLALFLGLTSASTLLSAFKVAFWVWLGFQAVESVGVVLWEGKTWNLFALKAGHQLVNLLLMSAVLSYLK